MFTFYGSVDGVHLLLFAVRLSVLNCIVCLGGGRREEKWDRKERMDGYIKRERERTEL